MNHRVACAAGLAVIVLAGAPAFAVENKDVRVVNTPAERIPVEATGTVALAPGAQVGVAGFVHLAPFTGPVSLPPGTEVNVANTAESPLHVVATAPAAVTLVRQVTLEWDNALGWADIDVPAGKRLVIEYLGGRVLSSGGMTVDFRILPVVLGGGAEFLYAAPGRQLNTNPELSHVYQFTEAVRLYHDGSMGTLRVGAIKSEGEEPALATVSLSGYLINTP